MPAFYDREPGLPLLEPHTKRDGEKLEWVDYQADTQGCARGKNVVKSTPPLRKKYAGQRQLRGPVDTSWI